MPNTNSAKKRLRQNITRRDRNRAIKSTVRTHVRKVHEAIKAADVEQSEIAFRLATKRLDQAATKKVLHRNKVARVKSRLSKAIQEIQASG